MLPSQVLIKQEANAPAPRYTDNYVATHGRVPRRAARGNSSARAAGAASRAAETRAQGHLTRWEPQRKPGPGSRAANRGRGEMRRAGDPTARRGSGRGRLGAAAGLGAHRLRLLGAPLPPPPPPSPPSPPLPGLASSPRRRLRLVPGRGRVLPLSPGRVSSQSSVSPPPPPLFSPRRRSRPQSSALKPTWRRRRRRLPERESATRRKHGPPSRPPPPPWPSRSLSPSRSADTKCVTTKTTLEHHGKCSLRAEAPERLLAGLRSHASLSNSC